MVASTTFWNSIGIMILQIMLYQSGLGQHTMQIEQDTTKKLFPYLGINERYGYADSKGNVQIAPQYDRVDFFHNGVAVVRRKGEKDMLINTNNQPVSIPVKYTSLKLLPFPDYTLVEFTREYANHWRFWEWTFLPDFSFFGTPSRNRLFDTKVFREKRTLYWLEGQHRIQSKKGGGGKTRFDIWPVAENTVQVDDNLYRISPPTMKRIAKGIVVHKNVGGSYYLQKKGHSFQVVDSTGKRVMPIKLQSITELTLDVEGVPLVLPTEKRQPFYYKLADFYEDESGNSYVHPDLSKRFPRHIKPYPFQDSMTAEEILKKAQTVAVVPESDQFLLTLDFGKRVFALDTAGNWQDPNAIIGKITVVSRSGSILWPGYETELGSLTLPDSAKVISIHPFEQHSNWYMVRIQQGEEQRLTGVWDKETESWCMPPQYYETSYSIFQHRFLTFKISKEGKWGVYDLVNRKVHIPAVYDFLDTDGWAYLYGETPKGFYLNMATKQEFREKKKD